VKCIFWMSCRMMKEVGGREHIEVGTDGRCGVWRERGDTQKDSHPEILQFEISVAKKQVSLSLSMSLLWTPTVPSSLRYTHTTTS